jgi:hypothetical protein
MNLTKADIAKFKALYKKHFDIELDDQNAMVKLSHLVRQMEIVHQPITVKQLTDLIDRDIEANSQPATD